MVASVEGLILGVSYFTILWCHPSPMLILLLCGFLQKSSLCSSLLPNFEPNALFRAHFTLHLSIQSIFFSPGSECILSIPTLVQGLFILPHLVVQLLSNARLFETPWTATSQVSLSFTISQSMLKLMSIKVAMPSSHLIFCCLLLPLPSIFLNIRGFFSSELGLCIRSPKYWNFSFSISPSNEYSEFISFRIDWFDLLAVQGTLERFLQNNCLKASILQC